MKPEITFKRKSIDQIYTEHEPKGMNQYAPRVGYYKVIRKCKVVIGSHILDGVLVNWKLNIDDEFDTSFETRIQLETFKLNPYVGSSRLLQEDLTGITIHIKLAAREYDGTGRFIVDWEVLPTKKTTIDDLNNLLSLGEFRIVDSALQSTEDLDLDADVIDYGVDDDQDY